MKKKFNDILLYLHREGANILELLNQNYNIFFYGCLLGNIIIIFILFIQKIYLVCFIFSLSMLIVLNMNRLIKVGEINLYADAHKRILYLNIILLLLNFINIFFNVFRYIFYDIIKIIREFTRVILLNYFKIEIPLKIDFYIENIVAYVAFDVVYTTLVGMFILYIQYIIFIKFDLKKEKELIDNDNIFGCFSNIYLLNLSRFCSIYIRSFILLIIYDGYFNIRNKKGFVYFVILELICAFFALIFGLQFTITGYLRLGKKKDGR